MAENTTPATPAATSAAAPASATATTDAGEQMSNERVAQLLLANMANLVRQGKLTQQQILQLKQFADKHKLPAQSSNAAASTSTSTTTTPKATASSTAATATPANTHKPSPDTASSDFMLTSAKPSSDYWTSQTLSTTNPGPVQWPQTRPTLTGGIAGGRMSGTPAQIARSDDGSTLASDDNRSRSKNTPGHQSMRRTIQDLVASVDPNVKIESEVEDLLLNVADEFIDSVTNFACRLARHRGGDTLEVRDLQLHLERNHNIRIPGFASDETRIALSQTTVAPPPAPTGKKTTQGTHMTLRSQRLAQVQHTKREAKLM
jgi:transcription initiation factor TFIID subunit 12